MKADFNNKCMCVSFNNSCHCDSVRCCCLHHLELEAIVGIVKCGEIPFNDSSLRSVGQWWIVQVSSLVVVFHICRNKLLDDTSGPVTNSNPEVRSSGTGKHRTMYHSSRTSLRIRVRHRSEPRTQICIWVVEYHWTILQADTTRTSEKLVPIYQCTRCLLPDDP